MNKFKINDTVKTVFSNYGFGVVHDVSENGMRYLVDDGIDFGWFAEKDIKPIGQVEEDKAPIIDFDKHPHLI